MVNDRPGKTDAKNLTFTIDIRGASNKYENDPPKYNCKYVASVNMKFGGSGWKSGDMVDVEMEGQGYRVIIKSVGEVNTFGNIDIHPDVTPTTGDTILSQQVVLQNIKKAIDEDPRCIGYEVELVGGGLYIKNETMNFILSTPETTLMKIITDQANDVGELPPQCKDGYVC